MENVKLKVENVSKKLNKEMILSNINCCGQAFL